MSAIDANSPVQIDDPQFEGGVWEFLYDMPAWGISLIVHVGILVGLMSLTYVIDAQQELLIESNVIPDEVLEEQYVVSTEITEELGSDSQINIAGPSLATAQQSGFDNHKEQDQRLDEIFVNPRLQQPQTPPTPNEAEMLTSLDLTGTTEHVGGTDGAIDRIVQEIAASLRQRKTLVVWLMDESLSMEGRRAEVAARFEGIYKQLGQLDIGADEALRSGVVGYGEHVHVLQEKPTADLSELLAAVNSIENDKSGQEKVFTAVNEALRVFLPAKRRMKANMMMILVTDERGDDYDMLENTVKRCSREGVKAYCIGNSAVFGREKGYIETTWEADGETFTEDLPADMGPETVRAECVQIPFWLAKTRHLNRMSSGYGPYTLSRLCTETGGVFFLAADNNRIKWDNVVMRRYTPDYRPVANYVRELSSNRAKAALINAAELTMLESGDVPIPQLVFMANNDNILRQQITEAQKPLATLDYYVMQLQAQLEGGESDRAKLDSDRWRAGYDLALGRTLAMRVRALGYNAMLADMKSNPKTFTKEGSNQWELVPSDDIGGGATVRKLHKRTMEYLGRVIDEHAGTPWAYFATAELSAPLGWEWQERQIAMAAQNMGNNNNNNTPRPQFAPEEEARRREMRRRQQKKQMSRPNL